MCVCGDGIWPFCLCVRSFNFLINMASDTAPFVVLFFSVWKFTGFDETTRSEFDQWLLSPHATGNTRGHKNTIEKGNCMCGYLRVPPPFAARQAFVVVVVVVNGRRRQTLVVVVVVVVVVDGGVGQTVESLGSVEIELIPPDQVVQSEESFHFLQFRPRVSYESF